VTALHRERTAGVWVEATAVRPTAQPTVARQVPGRHTPLRPTTPPLSAAADGAARFSGETGGEGGGEGGGEAGGGGLAPLTTEELRTMSYEAQLAYAIAASAQVATQPLAVPSQTAPEEYPSSRPSVAPRRQTSRPDTSRAGRDQPLARPSPECIELVAMGFHREKAERALELADNDCSRAVGLLFSETFTLDPPPLPPPHAAR
jgi:hypothetical protein